MTMENEANRPKNIVIRWIKYLVSLLWQSQFICILTSMDSTQKKQKETQSKNMGVVIIGAI